MTLRTRNPITPPPQTHAGRNAWALAIRRLPVRILLGTLCLLGLVVTFWPAPVSTPGPAPTLEPVSGTVGSVGPVAVEPVALHRLDRRASTRDELRFSSLTREPRPPASRRGSSRHPSRVMDSCDRFVW